MCGCNSNFKGDSKVSDNIWNEAKGGSNSSPCYICPDETIMGEPYIGKNGEPVQNFISGCEFNSDGSVFMIKAGNIGYGANSYFAQNGCPTSGWNSQGLFVSGSPSGSSNNSSPTIKQNNTINRRVRTKKSKAPSKKSKAPLMDNRSEGGYQRRDNPSKGMASTEKLMQEHKARFSAFMGEEEGVGQSPYVDIKKHGIPEEQYFEYNAKHRGNFSNFTEGRGFKHANELEDFDF